MQWENLSAPKFSKAVKECGRVCVLAMGCLEKHFDHLPLGTDYLNIHAIACKAAELEPAMVFPPYYIAQINEARPFPGTFALDADLALKMLEVTCDEIGRNGFSKIILFNGHGGNATLIDYFIQGILSRRRSYALYRPPFILFPEGPESKAILETDLHGHACECETSISLALHPELVEMDAVGGREGRPLSRYDALPKGGRISAQWYAKHPDHYCGIAEPASAEKGRKLVDIGAKALAAYIHAVRNDDNVLAVMKEFYDRCDEVGK